MLNRMTLVTACLLLSSATLLRAVAPPPPKVLILADKSPGSILFTMTYSCIGTDAGWDLEVCEDATKFGDKINSADWSRIFVFHKDVALAADFVITLRAWSEAHPERPIQWFIWKVPTTTVVDPSMAILPTTAFVTWQHHRSVIGYAITKATKESEAKTHPGLVLPDFENIELEAAPLRLGAIGSAPQLCPSGATLALSASFAIAELSACRSAALVTFLDEMEWCDARRKATNVICDKLYKPRPADPNDPNTSPFAGDVQKWIKCKDDANKQHSACMKNAGTFYKLQIAVCKKKEEATSQPSE